MFISLLLGGQQKRKYPEKHWPVTEHRGTDI
jgi:hypothetical protein